MGLAYDAGVILHARSHFADILSAAFDLQLHAVLGPVHFAAQSIDHFSLGTQNCPTHFFKIIETKFKK